MNWKRLEGRWMQLKGKVRQQWGVWTDDTFVILDGHREELAGKMRQRRSFTKDEAEPQLKELNGRVN